RRCQGQRLGEVRPLVRGKLHGASRRHSERRNPTAAHLTPRTGGDAGERSEEVVDRRLAACEPAATAAVTGMAARSVVPVPRIETMCRVPPRASRRSSMLVRPLPRLIEAGERALSMLSAVPLDSPGLAGDRAAAPASLRWTDRSPCNLTANPVSVNVRARALPARPRTETSAMADAVTRFTRAVETASIPEAGS